MALYALLVGVGTYEKKGLQQLLGPVKDATKMETWLRSRFRPEELFIRSLHDTAATKAAVAEGFAGHLAKAGAADQILFYFSGHGALEEPHPLLARFEPGRPMETIVCYDSLSSASTLADKELRYLIHKLSEKCPNILVIMDSCHSGHGTRNPEMVLKRLSDKVAVRDWQAFIFPTGMDQRLEAAAQLVDVLPEGPHIQLAACQPGQSAWEVRGAAIFTANLLQVLAQTQGNISYADVFSRVKYLIANRFSQVPALMVVEADTREYGSRLFPGGAQLQPGLTNANVVYNVPANSWLLDKGAIHGVRKPSGLFELPIYDGANTVTLARVTAILPDRSLLQLQDPTIPRITYSAVVPDLYRQRLNILPAGEEQGIKVLGEFYAAFRTLYEEEGIGFSTEPALTNYMVIAYDGGYWLVRPEEYDPHRELLPLLGKVAGYNELSARLLFNSLVSVVRWEFAKNLLNKDTLIDPFPLQLRFTYMDGNGVEQTKEPDDTNKIEAGYPATGKTILRAKIQLVNRSKNPYYCAVVILGIDFGIVTDLLSGAVEYIEPGEMRWIKGEKGLRFFQEDSTADYNRKDESYYFLLIASTELFEISALAQQGLPLPVRSRQRGEPRPIDPPRAREGNLPKADWSTRLIRVQLSNPFYKEATGQPNL